MVSEILDKIINLIGFIPQQKGKPGSVFDRAVLDPVQANPVVKSDQTEHGQEETHPETDAPPKLERIIGSIVIPAIGSLEECQPINGAAWVGGKRITQLHGILIK